jgi:DNA-binding winged helix-turn-helix (wHTH) protein
VRPPRRVTRSRPPRSGALVEVLRWPLDADRRPGLLEDGRACLWLLDRGELVPDLGRSEDWARLPIDERDLHARVQRLVARAQGSTVPVPGEVSIDHGLLTFRDQRVVVSVMEADIMERLAVEPGWTVGRHELTEAVWPGEHKGDRALDRRIHTLRGRIAPLGLVIHTVRGRGFLLAAGPRPSPDPARRRATPRRTQWSSS